MTYGRKDYSEDDIFIDDEIELFFKMKPDKTSKFKGKKCVGGKMAKDCITVFVCAKKVEMKN